MDPSLVKDPSLILYDAMLALERVQVVSNGDQTKTIVDSIGAGGSFAAALGTREREPDAPNYTPRIAGLLDFRRGEGRIELGILKANPIDSGRTDRYVYRPATPSPGFGYGLTTYRGDGTPLPSFAGDPLLLPLEGRPIGVLDAYWEALHPENRVAAAVKAVDPAGRLQELRVKNRHA